MILVRGKVRKSVYFEMLYKNAHKPLMILYGNDKPVHLMDLGGCYIIPRNEKTYDDLLELESELNEIMAQILVSSEYSNIKTIFVYGNFDPSEIEALTKLNHKLIEFFSFVFTIQDNDVPVGQIVIDESVR